MTTKAEYRDHNDMEFVSRALRAHATDLGLNLAMSAPEICIPFAAFAARCAPMTSAKVLQVIRSHPGLICETLGVESGTFEPSRYVKGVGHAKALLRVQPIRLARVG